MLKLWCRLVVAMLWLPALALLHQESQRIRKNCVQNFLACKTKCREEASPVPLSSKEATTSDVLRCVTVLSHFMATTLLAPSRSLAQRGAFEMDAEFYFQNLLGQRKTKGNSLFKSGAVFPSPRKLDGEFSAAVFSIILNELAASMHVPASDLLQEVNSKAQYGIKVFQTFAPIEDTSLRDQYYFDMLLYIAYNEAGRVVSSSADRVALRERIGDRIFEYITKLTTVGEADFKHRSDTGIDVKRQAELLYIGRKGITQLLEVFQEKKFIGGYKFDEEALDDEYYILQSFQEDLPVSFQVTLISPVTLLSFIQQAKANTLFHPEIIATTISSYLRRLCLQPRFKMIPFRSSENFLIIFL